ncbi:MAG: TOMM precursor leader peptide-binding protein [Nostoc sp. DedQUE12a]|nr:TOMM precursor leader peptide-binding protein [Nostoc sp. DedQUE12a]
MLNKPKFKSCFHIEILETPGYEPIIFLLSELKNYVLKGYIYKCLAPLLNGHHTVDEIIILLQGKLELAKVYYGLSLLEKKGYIVEGEKSFPIETETFWELLGVDGRIATKRLNENKVSVTSFGAVPTQQLISILESLDIQISENSDFSIVLTDDYLQVGLDAFNQKALKSERPWMLIKPTGSIAWIGPIFQPGKTGCWECLAHRLRANREVETFIQQKKGTSEPFPTSRAALISTSQTVLNLAATEIAKWLVQGQNQQLEGKVVTLNCISLEQQKHILTQRPQCPSCGKKEYLSNNHQPLPLLLESRKKLVAVGAGHRCSSPDDTFKQYEHHISPITGVVNALYPVALPKDQNLIHVYVAGHNMAIKYDNFSFLRNSLRSKSSGKGMTDLQAKVSGLCEAIERYSGVFQGYEIRQKGSYKEMGDVAIHPNTCMNFSEAQYNNRKDWNYKHAVGTGFNTVPKPFDEEKLIEWTPVWSLTNQQFKYIPTAYCYYNYLYSKEDYFCNADSNGNASGTTKEEAILQGFLELVERDSICLWWYNRLRKPVVNLETFGEPYFLALQDYHKSIHRDIWVLDITSDLNIPSFVGISRRNDKVEEDIVIGFGCHFDPKIAISRALTEVNQFLPPVLSVDAHSNTEYTSFDPAIVNWWKTATLENQHYLKPDETVASKVFSDYPQIWNDDILEDVMNCVKIAAKHGMETLVLDQTRSDVCLNVVKVIVPGMRHFWARFAPGRLYDVPVKMGWLKEPLSETQLNPIPMFL